MDANAVAMNNEDSLRLPHSVGHSSRIHSLGNSKRIQPITNALSLEVINSGDEEKKLKEPATLSKWLRLEEFSSLETWRATFAEFLGMATACFAMDVMVVGTLETDPQTGILLMSILAAIIISIMLIATFPVSGGHLNPAISFCAALMGLVSVSRAFMYIVAQSLGAVIGTLAFKAVVSNQIGTTYSFGGCNLGVIVQGPNGPYTMGIGTGQGLWLEILSMFMVLYSAGSIGFVRNPALSKGPVFNYSIIGIMVGMAIYVTGTVTQVKGYPGAGLNPARCIGPAIVMGGHLWDRHWVFWVGPGIASVAFYLYTKIVPSQHFYA
ncbi:probable aquaporin TIP3-1 [Telopea speciosissima]|uniref:probable aquaporin TIP3-1 n=1 Tax=Telopea speciosissima TaxID=54955 RepID=UPI001CC610F9|nr:probable aquaporin TIP3-1 [Telopea speciosissima]